MTGIPDRPLCLSARLAAQYSHSPYSGYRVGAAVFSSSGKTFQGCNIENGSLGLDCCAERVAIFKMVSNGHKAIDTLTVYTPTQEPVAPCGACRQVINEFGPKCLVVCVCDGPGVLEVRANELLPSAFDFRSKKKRE